MRRWEEPDRVFDDWYRSEPPSWLGTVLVCVALAAVVFALTVWWPS